mgnify:CR=1 FL=1
MNLLIFSRPGIRLYQELRRSETAWNALRFYGPVETPVGIIVEVSSLSAALSLASDLKYFIRKFGSDYLFEIAPGMYCTPSVARSRYLEREPHADPWPWKIWYRVKGDGNLVKYDTFPELCTRDRDQACDEDVFEVLCSEEECTVCRLCAPEAVRPDNLQKTEEGEEE